MSKTLHWHQPQRGGGNNWSTEYVRIKNEIIFFIKGRQLRLAFTQGGVLFQLLVA